MRFFERLRVVDLSHVWVGPTATRVLADLGADVIRIERPDRPDGIRTLVPAGNDMTGDYWEHAPNFIERNAGKRSVALDLKTGEGREILARLIDAADIVVENFTPRVMKSFGFDYETLKPRYPRLIMLSITGFGQTGPMAATPISGVGMEPAAGVSSVTGYRGGPPAKTGNTWIDPFVGIHAAAALIAALIHRERTGEGQYIEVSMQEGALQVLGRHLMDYAMNRRVARPSGSRTPSVVRGIYPCAGDDEWVAITIRDDREWRALCEVAGNPEWATDPRFAHHESRMSNHDDVDQTVAGWTRGQSKLDVMGRLQQASVPAGALLKADGLTTNEHLLARRFFDAVEIPDFGLQPIHRALVAHIDGVGFPSHRPSPKIGEHTNEVLSELGMSDEEIAELRAHRVIDARLDLFTSPEARQAAKVPLEEMVTLGSLLRLDPTYKETCRGVVERLLGGDADNNGGREGYRG